MKKPQVVGAALTLALVVLGKQYFRTATADDLRWLLAPTAKCVSVLTGKAFVHETAGYANHSIDFVIAPVCAGLHFMLAALLALSLGWFAGMQSWRAMTERLIAAVGVAYAATIVFNTLRISLSIELHAEGELHRMLGVVIYLGGLCALYAAARRADHQTIRGARWLAVPVAAYLAITLALPLVHGAAGPAFVAHATWVLVGTAIVIALALVVRLANNHTRSRVSGGPS